MSIGGATHGFATAVAVRLRHKPKGKSPVSFMPWRLRRPLRASEIDSLRGQAGANHAKKAKMCHLRI
jgi:hypothetical protein